MKHNIELSLKVPVSFDGQSWSADDQTFGMPLEPAGSSAVLCPTHSFEDDPRACVRAADRADDHPLDSWELTQLLAKAHGAVLIGAAELERLRFWATQSDAEGARWPLTTDGDSTDAIEDAGRDQLELHEAIVSGLRRLNGFSPRTGRSIQTAMERQK